MSQELFIALALITAALLLVFFSGKKRAPKRPSPGADCVDHAWSFAAFAAAIAFVVSLGAWLL